VTTLHVFDFHSTVNDTYTHHGEHVVCGIRVIIDTTEKGGSSVGSDSSLDEVCSTGMVFGETRTVVNESVNGNQRSILGFCLEIVP